MMKNETHVGLKQSLHIIFLQNPRETESIQSAVIHAASTVCQALGQVTRIEWRAMAELY